MYNIDQVQTDVLMLKEVYYLISYRLGWMVSQSIKQLIY